MDKLNQWNCLTYRGVARALGISVWRIRYAIDSGYLPAPSVVLKRRALFSPEQIEAMKGFFEVEDAHRRKGISEDDLVTSPNGASSEGEERRLTSRQTIRCFQTFSWSTGYVRKARTPGNRRLLVSGEDVPEPPVLGQLSSSDRSTTYSALPD